MYSTVITTNIRRVTSKELVVDDCTRTAVYVRNNISYWLMRSSTGTNKMFGLIGLTVVDSYAKFNDKNGNSIK